MVDLSSYHIIEQIHKGDHSVVYRARRLRDDVPVMIKRHRTDNPSAADLTRYSREVQIGQQLEGKRVIKYYGLENFRHSLVVITEDVGGTVLKNEIPATGMDIPTFLDIAVELAEALREIHQQNVIHKDINPHNIVVVTSPKRSPDNPWQVKIIDFGLSVQLNQGLRQLSSPKRLEGTLTYLSPEQIGRMNRAIDYRTDFYSLGATFYEMLCGQPPFVGVDDMELVYSHMAIPPVPPFEMRSDIPEMLSAIVIKLLAKNAEDRYQSPRGLQADLLKCRSDLKKTGDIQPFDLGTQDISERFQLPQRLYGREQEIELLLESFERISRSLSDDLQVTKTERVRQQRTGDAFSQLELLLVSGYPGVGKSTLVNEIQKPVVQKRGIFISGKYGQLQRTVPYTGISQAFDVFCRHLLTEPAEVLDKWQQKIKTAVGNSGQVLIDIIPALEQIIGPQSPVAKVGAQETQNRFNMLFQNFTRAICSAESPLVLFLDNLQWADRASLDLLKVLLIDSDIQDLLIIGAYRDNEVDTSHPLSLTLTDIKRSGKIVNTIHLDNLAHNDVNQLIADTLQSDLNFPQPLADLVYDKTQGNAFFTRQFLESLYREELLRFVHPLAAGDLVSADVGWQWDIDQIKAKSITDNMVTLMTGKISQLPVKTQTMLKLAACIGDQFDLQTLATIAGNDHRADGGEQTLYTFLRSVLMALWPAMQLGFILPLDENYRMLLISESDLIETTNFTSGETNTTINSEFKFTHDQIQLAAYSLIDNNEREITHLQIARLLYADHKDRQDFEDHIFEITDQFEQGIALLDDEAERIAVARLNLLAGQAAKQATAYETAATYFKAGVDLMSEEMWRVEYRLMFDLHKELAEAAYLAVDFETASSLYPLLLQQAQSDTDKLAVYLVQVDQLTRQNKQLEALAVETLGLKMLGIDLPETEVEMQTLLEAELNTVQKNLGKHDIDIVHLADASVNVDKKQRVMMELLSSMVITAYILARPLLAAWASARTTNISLQYGPNDISAYGYANYGINVAITHLEDYETAHRFGRLAIALANRFDNPVVFSRSYYTFADTINHWRAPLASNIDYYRRAHQAGAEGGELNFATYAAQHLIMTQLAVGRNLDDVQAEAEDLAPFIKRSFPHFQDQYLPPGVSETLAALRGEDEQREMLPFVEYNNPLRSNIFYSNEIRRLYWLGLYREAAHYLEKIDFITDKLQGFVLVAEAHFFMSLTLTAIYNQASPAEQATYDDCLDKFQARMRIWADGCPDNFLHKYLLVEAERAAIVDKVVEAMSLYKQAISSAGEFNFIHLEALGNELYAKFWLELDETGNAQFYMARACGLYSQWGASAKINNLERRYPQLSAAFDTTTDETVHKSSMLDLNTVIKASQAISGEINLDKLLTQLVTTVIQNAGAQKGFLILENDGDLLIEAAGTADDDKVIVRQAQPLAENQALSAAIVRYVVRTGENVILDDATQSDLFKDDAYIQDNQPRSVLSMPLWHHGALSSVLYLENNLATGAFTPDRLAILELLSAQITISLENARLYAHQEALVAARTQALSETLDKANKLAVELETVAQVGTAASSLLDTSELLQQVTDLTKSSFGLYHAHIYLLDERAESLVLVAGAGEVGRQMVAEGWQIPIESEQSLVSRAARNREGFIVNDVREDKAWLSNPLLPDTRSELAVPLLVGNDVLGVLDVQANEVGYFTEGDIQVQSTLAAQIATALNNAQMFEQIKEANAIAEKADRLKTRLLANVSHELRTPLNVILGYTQAGLDSSQQKKRRSAALSVKELQHIDSNAHHLLRVINDLLDLSRAEIDELDLHLELIDSRQLLEETFRNMVDTTTASDVKWTLSLPSRLPAIQADQVRMRQVLLNLLSNAAKFTQAGEIILGADVNLPYLHIWVRDTGIGIDVEFQERIFEPFVTGQAPGEQAEGIGLGLSITHRLVTMHRGSMTVESQVDEGTIFHVYLPLPNLSNRPATFVPATEPVLLLLSAREEAPAEIVELCKRQGLDIRRLEVGQDLDAALAQEQPAALAWDLAHANPGDWQLIERLRQDARWSQLPFILYNQPQDETVGLEVGLINFVSKPVTGNTLLEAINASRPVQAVGPILIVDDDALARELYQDMINKGLPGYPVLTAKNGVVALDLMAQETPCLVILDLIMPEMDGFDMLDEMRGNPQFSQIPVIILSGRVLTLDDISRIEQHKLVTLQSKGILSEAETITFLNQTLFGTDTLPQHTQALVKRTVAYLQQNYDRRLARWEIAEGVGVSENYLTRIFRQELGLSPWEYLNRYRVVKAQELLRHTDHSIKAVALQTGFKDRTYFSRVFKKVTGMSPGAYRESSE